ncbi:membrane bound O-acyl transferase family-domain-containing protein [Chaetomium strumarium]|uniref:Membrane bound O-acyl transferase family-domain-containing protein n=1 Tax=Chaetomium strumarium TaxID=1170767 RepID=A0AAJ0M0C9_9PEZI|nr:membrane bound O-acyl transferase family-domain-containing protein [Chaetomium strumarium]
MTVFTTNALHGLHLSRRDFGPDKQGLLPPLTERDLYLRALVSSQWIWDTCLLLTSAHDLLAAVFVSVLQWDRPPEWPPLFGSITEAYSLRRFWGVFWHRLHVAVFDAYLSMVFRVKSDITFRALRALWMFMLSALFHAISNWVLTRRFHAVPESRFFLSNYVVCLAETILESNRGTGLLTQQQLLVRSRSGIINLAS